jgi:hypothetical protein
MSKIIFISKVKKNSGILVENDLQELLRLVIEAIAALRTFTVLPEDEQLIKNRIEFFSTLKNRVINEIEMRKK